MTHGVGAFAPRRIGDSADRHWSLLPLIQQRVEPVELVAQRFNFLPRVFRWRGNLWRVQQITNIYEHGTDRQARRYFRVRCQDDRSYLLYQDLRIGTWHLSV